MASYFETIDSELKAYLLGTIVFNIHNVKHSEVFIELNGKLSSMLKNTLKELVSYQENSASFIISSPKTIAAISKQLNVSDLSYFYNIDISYFVQNNKKEYVIEFLKAFYEKYGGIRGQDGEDACIITTNSKENLDVFSNFFGIPCTQNTIFNLSQILYKGPNIIDLLGVVYRNVTYIVKDDLYLQFLQLLNTERPILKFLKIDDRAVTPTKANFSDVGYDISIIAKHKQLCESTSLYNTGIKLNIPVGYYVELAPRSSLSKSGYMLANSIGIIDCSYKGELLVALAKISSDAQAIEYPFRCCQLIMRKQIFPDMLEIAEELMDTCRAEGGFGST